MTRLRNDIYFFLIFFDNLHSIFESTKQKKMLCYLKTKVVKHTYRLDLYNLYKIKQLFKIFHLVKDSKRKKNESV